jgi:hypothetical protein
MLKQSCVLALLAMLVISAEGSAITSQITSNGTIGV